MARPRIAFFDFTSCEGCQIEFTNFGDAATLLEVHLHTGRTHQIRAQLSSRGHAIVGDAKYGGGKPPMFLHAWRLSIDGEIFECPPPWTGRWAVASSR